MINSFAKTQLAFSCLENYFVMIANFSSALHGKCYIAICYIAPQVL